MASYEAIRAQLGDAYIDGSFMRFSDAADSGNTTTWIVDRVIDALRRDPRFGAIGYYELLHMLADVRADVAERLAEAEDATEKFGLDSVASGLEGEEAEAA